MSCVQTKCFWVLKKILFDCNTFAKAQMKVTNNRTVTIRLNERQPGQAMRMNKRFIFARGPRSGAAKMLKLLKKNGIQT